MGFLSFLAARAASGSSSRFDFTTTLTGRGVGSRSADLLPSELFHGTRHAFDRFVLDHEGRKDFGWLGRGIYLTDIDIIASMYASQKRGPDAPRVLTVTVAPGKIYRATAKDKERISPSGPSAARAFSEKLIRKGYIGAVLDHGNFGREFVIFDPSRIEIRSVRELGQPLRQRRPSPLDQQSGDL